MVKRLYTPRRKSRARMRKHYKQAGKISVSRFFQSLQPGTRVVLDVEPAVQRGSYPLRFHNLSGTVLRRRGRCYEVQINDGGKPKLLIVHPVHLRKL